MGLVHEVREPAGEPQGALVLLHGRGSDQHDLLPLAEALDPERMLVAVTPGAPLTDVPPGGRHWYLVPRVGFPDPGTFAAAYAVLTAFLDDFLVERGIGWDRTVIGGFSMGCVMSYSVGLGPGRPSPAAILALSGFIPTVEGWEPDLEGRAGLPVLVHHGTADPIIGVHFARTAAELLAAAGLEVDFRESDAGHFVPPAVVPLARELLRRVLPQA